MLLPWLPIVFGGDRVSDSRDRAGESWCRRRTPDHPIVIGVNAVALLELLCDRELDLDYFGGFSSSVLIPDVLDRSRQYRTRSL